MSQLAAVLLTREQTNEHNTLIKKKRLFLNKRCKIHDDTNEISGCIHFEVCS